jgi:hypothetical protein
MLRSGNVCAEEFSVQEKNTVPWWRHGVVGLSKEPMKLQGVYNQNLTVFVVSARWASDVRWHFRSTFWAGFQQWCTPAIGATTHFLAALGLTAFRYGHSSV